MLLNIGDIDIYFEVYGSKLNIETDCVTQKPTLLFLHGGPGLADHTLYVNFWSQLADVAQVIFIDMRGQGRSGGWDKPNTWNLKQWGQDVISFCNTLKIEKPILAGFSFGGWVALSCAIESSKDLGGLILCNTEAKIDNLRRIEAYRKKANARNLDGDEIAKIVENAALNIDDKDTAALYVQHCIPLFSNYPYKKEELSRCKQNLEVWNKFEKEEQYSFNYLPELDKISTPTLVIAGQEDPEHPWECAKEMADRMTSCSVQFELIQDAGDPVYRDKPAETLKILREFIRTT